jgi:Flp pilus assembly protein TadB
VTGRAGRSPRVEHGRVGNWLLRAPWWVLSLVTGGLFGVNMALFGALFQEERWPVAVVGGVLAGVLFGAVMGPLLARQNRRWRDSVGTSSTDDLRRARRAARGGPVPTDPEQRALAHRLVTTQLGELRRRRRLSVTVFSVFLVLEAVMAVTRSPWFWLAAAFFAAMLALVLAYPRRLERRAAELAPPDGDL